MMTTILKYRTVLRLAWRCRGDHRGCYRRVCVVCGEVFYTGRPEARYCRPACRQRAYRNRHRIRRNMT